MIKILIVEDIEAKSLIIKKLFEVNEDNKQEEIEVKIANSIISAKRALSNHYYDLCILDINLPIRDEEQPVKNSAITLLDELHDRELTYNIPGQIVGLTSYEDAYDFGISIFNKYLYTLILYDEKSNDWSNKLLQLKRRLKSAHQAEEEIDDSNKITICVVNALPTPELEALLKCGWNWTELNLDNDPSQYFKSEIKSECGNELTIVTAACDHMGMPSAIPLAMKMIHHFTPQYLGMTGICAGKRKEVNVGDIVIADPSWDWGSGKYAIENGKSIFKASPYQISLSSTIRNIFRKLKRDQQNIPTIRAGWNGKVPEGKLEIHLGPVATGASVLSDENLVKEIEKQHRKIIGIEMETFGIFSAAINSTFPQPTAFSIKSVCDFADSQKDDDHQEYAAYTSAAAFKIFVEKYL